jgi:RHS repeat-associated protein
VQKIANPATPPVAVITQYFYDNARVIEEQNPALVPATQATYVYGNYIDEVLTMERNSQTYYYHQNALWSVEAITDSTGTAAERYAYDAYGFVTVTTGAGVAVPQNPWGGGTPHSAIGNPYTFTGRQLDEEAGLYYYRMRYYDSGKGRFLQRDPVGYVDGMNLYEYVSDNPINYPDPMGLTAKYQQARIYRKWATWPPFQWAISAWIEAQVTCNSSDGCHCDGANLPTGCNGGSIPLFSHTCKETARAIVTQRNYRCPCNLMECHELKFDWEIRGGVSVKDVGLYVSDSGNGQTIRECADGTKYGERYSAWWF